MLSKLEVISKYFFFFVLFYIFHSANIQGITPFAFGLLFALVWCNQKIYILAPLYVLAGFLTTLSVQSLIIDGVTVVVFALAYFLHYKFKKPLNPILIGFYAFLSQFGRLYIASFEPALFWQGIVSLILGLICMYAYLHLFQGIALKGLRRKYTLDEIVCFGVFMFALGAGLYSLPLGEYFFIGITTFIILFTTFIFGATQSLLVATFLGLGCAFSSEQFLYLSHVIFMSLATCATCCSKRVYACISVILVDILSGLYFLPFYNLEHLLCTFVGALLFLIIPKRFLNLISSYIIKDKEDVAVRTIINRNRQALQARLYELSEVFYDMKNVFYGMVKGVKDINEVSGLLVETIKQRNCANCINKQNCLRLYANETNRAFDDLVKYAYERGRVSLVDMPPVLTANCNRISYVINSINSIVDEYKSNLQTLNNLDSGKILLSEQMWGVSQIMKSLANEVSLNVTFDTSIERKIAEDLMYSGIVCSEAIVYHQQEEVCSVTLVVNDKSLNNEKINKVVSKTLNTPMEIIGVNKGEKAGYSVLIMQNSNAFDMVFGSAGAVKNDSVKSGDTHSILKLGKDKILLALCDGMGSGKEAERTSSLALGLLENFYKAGFDNELILTSVNKLLSLSGDEKFSAIDACVVDLHNGTCDMIKVGSPPSFIKGENALQRIDTGALPLGILEEIHPNIRSFVLKENDMIILATDGIIDSFSSYDEIGNLINETETTNPQHLANVILNKALENNKNFPADDMTVLIGRIYRKF